MASQKYIDKAQALIDKHPFLMLSKSWCPDCHYAYRVWDQFKVTDKVHVIELDKMDNQSEAIELEKGFTHIAGRKWVPTIFFNGKVWGTEQDLKRLASEDKLEESFKKENLI
ncbi:glutaredoxin-1 [[Candida] anglica]|uniref:Glutaredoxin-1 n=1 Tax=[Candida] anglica TaxID=148631 RepID=A0ABP0EC45_9ASCO